MGKSKKKNKFLVRRICIVTILILIIYLLISKIFFNTKVKVNEKTVFIVEDEITSLKNDVVVDGYKNIYVSYDDIKNIYDANIIYDDVNKKLITTYNKHVALLELDKNEIEINDAQSSISGKLQYINNILYLPFSDMKLVYDFEYSYADDTNTVMIDSISNRKDKGTTIRKATIKNKSNFFGKKITKISKNEEVTLFGEEDGYYKVRTSNGIIGYVVQNRIDNVTTVRDDMVDKKITAVNVLFKYSNIKNNYGEVDLDNKKINVVVPEIFAIKEKKNVDLKVSVKGDLYTEYKSWLDSNNMDLWATVTNSEDISNLMLTYNDRKEVINNICQRAVENQYKVINIKFDKINDLNSFYRFLIELAPRLREYGIKTVVTSNSIFNEDKVKGIVDYIVKEEKV